MAIRPRFSTAALPVATILTLVLTGSATAGDKAGYGTLGYGPPGLHPGFQGFSLRYHLGYGYGGRALGVGAFGGYPGYGGPGYPSPDPRTVFRPTGPLVPTRDVARIIDTGGPGTPLNFGQYTGEIPYPESQFAPYSNAGGIPNQFQQPPPTPLPARLSFPLPRPTLTPIPPPTPDPDSP